MHLVSLLSYFAGGAFVANGVPHFVTGVTGRPFQSPFAKPPGVGLSSSVANAGWGWLNLAVGYVLVARVGTFDPRSTPDAVAAGAGALVMALLMARYFGQFHGGRTSSSPSSSSSPPG